MRPPVCLQYAILATGATFSDKYHDYHDVFYKRARKYIEASEMKVSNNTLRTKTSMVPTFLGIWRALHLYPIRSNMAFNGKLRG